MKKIYHVCLSAGPDGVLCRDDEDYIRFINCIAAAGHYSEAFILAYVVMSNHTHLCIRTDDLRRFNKRWRYMYTRYFNQKYHRRGRLGGDPHVVELKGLYHILTAIAYILRNPMHHGVTATPFGYKYSSVNALFMKELGRMSAPALPAKLMYRYLAEGIVLPPDYRMDESGMLLPECIIDVEDVENKFSTARTFLYYMNRLSGRKWEEDQKQDNNGQPPVTIEQMEQGVVMNDLQTMLNNEFGRANYTAMTDITLCKKIDEICRTEYGDRSVYELSQPTLYQIGEKLRRQYHLSVAQINRCLTIA
jgi:hypothetical protein